MQTHTHTNALTLMQPSWLYMKENLLFDQILLFRKVYGTSSARFWDTIHIIDRERERGVGATITNSSLYSIFVHDVFAILFN
jgi:hypothetical protein